MSPSCDSPHAATCGKSRFPMAPWETGDGTARGPAYDETAGPAREVEVTFRAGPEPSVRGGVRLAHLCGDPSPLGDVPAVLPGPGPDLGGRRTTGPAGGGGPAVRRAALAAAGASAVADVERQRR